MGKVLRLVWGSPANAGGKCTLYLLQQKNFKNCALRYISKSCNEESSGNCLGIFLLTSGRCVPWQYHGVPWSTMEYHGVPWSAVEYRIPQTPFGTLMLKLRFCAICAIDTTTRSKKFLIFSLYTLFCQNAVRGMFGLVALDCWSNMTCLLRIRDCNCNIAHN